MENNMLKRYGNLLCIGDNRWPKRILFCSSEEKKTRGRSEMMGERGVKRVMKQKNVTLEDAVNRQKRRKAYENK